MIQCRQVIFDDFVPNWHVTRRVTEDYYLIFVTEGRLIYELDEEEITLAKGDALIICPGIVRSGRSGPWDAHQKYAAQFTIETPVHHPLSLITRERGNQAFQPQRPDYYHQRFAALYRMNHLKSSFRDLLTLSILMDIAGNLFHEFEMQEIPPHKQNLARKVEQYIRDHFKEEIRVHDLANLVQRTPNYVSTIFKDVIGQSPIQYMHHLRMLTARDMLTNSDMTIAEISEYLGYCDPTYFNRMFRKITGQPPSALFKQRSD